VERQKLKDPVQEQDICIYTRTSYLDLL